MYHSFLIHSSADGHLGCFHVLAIINSAAKSKSRFNKESYDKSTRHNIGCLSHEYCPVDFYYHSNSILLDVIWGIKYKGHKYNANFLLDKSSCLKITQFLIFLLLRLLNICHHGHIKSYTYVWFLFQSFDYKCEYLFN